MLRVEFQQTGLVLGFLGLPFGAALGQNGLHLGGRFRLTLDADDGQYTVRHVDLDQVVLFHQCNRAAYGSLRADMADDRAAACAGEAPVGNQCDAGCQLRVSADRLAGIEHLRHTAAARAFIADEDRIARLYLAVQNGGNAGFLTVVRSGAQRGGEHILRAGGVLDDTALGGKVALQDGNAAVGALGIVKAVDNILAGNRNAEMRGLFLQDLIAVLVEAVILQLLQILAQRLACDRQHVEMQHRLDFFHDAGHAACIIEVLGGPVAGRTNVQQIMRAAVHTVKGVCVDLNAELMGNGRQVHCGVGGAGNRRMNHDGVLKALFRDDVLRRNALLDQLHQLDTGIIGSLFQFGGGGRHQGRAGQHQAERLCHDLHRGGCAHEGAGAAGRAGVVLVVVQLLVGNDTGFLPGVKLADLLQRQQVIDGAGGVVDDVLFRQGVGFHHAARHHDGAHLFQTANAHQHGGYGFVTAGNEHAAVIDRGVGLCLHQIHDGVTVGQRVVDAVMPLGDAVAHIGGKVAGGLAAVLIDGLHGLPDELVKMGTAGMAVTEGAFHHDLRLAQVTDRPAHADFQRIVFRCQRADFLRMKFHKRYLRFFVCAYCLPLAFIVIRLLTVCKLYGAVPTLCQNQKALFAYFAQEKNEICTFCPV